MDIWEFISKSGPARSYRHPSLSTQLRQSFVQAHLLLARIRWLSHQFMAPQFQVRLLFIAMYCNMLTLFSHSTRK